MTSPIAVFDRRLLRQRRDRAAAGADGHDFLLRETAALLAERLELVKRPLPLIVDLGAHHGVFTEKLRQRPGTERVVSSDISSAMAARGEGPAVVADEEFLPFKAASLDAVVSNLSLHWVNDLPGALLQIRQALKTDGLFMATLLGGETLKELRQCLMEAELIVTGGASPRVSPFVDMRDMGALMPRAGFALPVVDAEKITVHYSSPLKLMRDLRGMGAANITHNRPQGFTRKAVLLEAARLYQEKFSESGGEVTATFEAVFVIGWAPAESQQKPLKPGTAKTRLAQALQTAEISAGEKAGC